MYAVITGASSGIGREFAVQLARRGYDIIIAARREQRLQQLADELRELYKVSVVVRPCDLEDRTQTEEFASFCAGYDVKMLVNNAGFGKIGLFEQIELSHDIGMINTNITALHILMKHFARSMESGYIVNIASMSAFQPNPGLAVYGATKAYVLSLSRAAGYEFRRQKKHISVTAVCPGPVNTEFNKVAKGSFSIKGISAERCVAIALKAIFKRKPVAIVGFNMKILRFLTKIMPARVILPIEYRIQQSKKLPR